jgi:hypothetical protein
MNLKLSTSAALTINSIAGLGDADSKTVLADKVAASYQKHFDIHDGDHRKRIFGRARNLQGRLQKAVSGPSVNLSAEASAANAVSGMSGASMIGKRPDVGILGKHAARGLRPDDNANLHNKKRVTGNLIANMIKKSTTPDIGILGKSKLGRHRSSTFLAHEPLQPPKQSVDDEAPEEGDRYHDYDVSYSSYYSVTNTYLCEDTGISGPRDPRKGTQGWIRQSVNNSSGTFLDDFPMPTCRCQNDQLSTCGPDLCNCLQNSEGDISSCMNEVNMLCEGTVNVPNSTSSINNNGTETVVEQALTIDQCTGNELSSASYCTMFPCVLGGGSYEQCMCDTMDHVCSTTSDELYSVVTCTISTCCQGQTDDAGRLSCLNDAIGGYYSPYTPYGSYGSPSFITDYYECVASPTNSTAACACSVLAPAYCELYSDYQYFCDIQTCCQGQTDDAGKVDCFTSTLYGTCIDIGYSKYFCQCETSSISCTLEADPKQCEVEQCCFYSSNWWDDEGHMKACLGLGDGNVPTPTNPVSGTVGAGVFAKSSKGDSKTSKTKASSKAKSSKAEIKQGIGEDMNEGISSAKIQVQYEVLNGADKVYVFGFLSTAIAALIAWGWFQ